MDQFFGPVTINDEGTFSSEKTVSFEHGGRTLSLIVDESDVSGDRVRVRVIREAEGGYVIDLPREPFSGGSRLLVPGHRLQK